VVQERVEPVRSVFPLLNYGHLEFREMQVDVHPHAYLGKVQGCSTWLSMGKTGFSSAAGIVPTFILDSKYAPRSSAFGETLRGIAQRSLTFAARIGTSSHAPSRDRQSSELIRQALFSESF
jgi:hypothetical protein